MNTVVPGSVASNDSRVPRAGACANNSCLQSPQRQIESLLLVETMLPAGKIAFNSWKSHCYFVEIRRVAFLVPKMSFLNLFSRDGMFAV